MNLRNLQKLSGIAVMLGALLMAVYTLGFTFLISLRLPIGKTLLMVLNPNWTWLTITVFFGILFLMFGFLGIYLRIVDKAKLTGLLGYIFIELAYLLQASKVTWEIFIYPTLAHNRRASFLLAEGILKNASLVSLFRTCASVTILIGTILFCAAIIRSKKFPAISGWLVLIGAVLYGIGPLLNVFWAMGGIFIFACGCFMLGKNLLQTK